MALGFLAVKMYSHFIQIIKILKKVDRIVFFHFVSKIFLQLNGASEIELKYNNNNNYNNDLT